MTLVRAAVVVAVVSVLAQIAYPLADGQVRDALTVGVVLASATAALLHATARRGGAWTLAMLLVTTGGGVAVELLGTATGFPFGEYAYAQDRLGPSVAGVPLVIGLAWTAGAYPAWCAAGRVAGSRRVRRWLLAAVGLAAWDLTLDPQMVADGLWTWQQQGVGLPGVPEVPWTNYLGWLGVALVMSALLTLLPEPGGPTGGDTLPLALFTWTWLGSALAHVAFLGLPVSGVYGLLGTAVLGVPLLACLARGVPAGTMGRCPSS